MIGRQILCPLARGNHVKPGGAGPIHHLRGQRRLVAIGERIDHAGLARFLGEQRTRQHVGLDVDHHDMLARRDRGAGVPDADGGIAGRLHHHVHRAAGNRARAVIGEDGRGNAGLVPPDRAAGLARTIPVDVDNDGDHEPRRVRYLRQKHRAEFSGADQRDTDGLAGGSAGLEKAEEVHGNVRS
ncbi:hypothetical protein ACVWW2_008162 [Bradyrhizobium sp. LM4.3]